MACGLSVGASLPACSFTRVLVVSLTTIHFKPYLSSSWAGGEIGMSRAGAGQERNVQPDSHMPQCNGGDAELGLTFERGCSCAHDKT